MRKTLTIIGLVLVFLAMTHHPKVQAQLPPAYQRNPLDTNGPVQMTNIVIAIAGGGGGVTIMNFYTTNEFSTNIIAQTINAISNFVSQQFVTQQFVSYQVVSNAFFTNVTIINGNGPWIPILNGFGTNTSIDTLYVFRDFYVIGSGPPIFELANGDTMLDEAGYDLMNHGGWWGSMSPTNIDFIPGGNITFTTNNHSVTIAASGVISSMYFASNAVSGGTFPAATIGSFTGDITTPGGSYATTLKNTGTAGTYRSVTFDAQGRETAGSNPTTFSGYGISDSSANLFAALTDDNGSTWTNLTYRYTTNVTGNGIFTFGKEYSTNLSGNITLGAPVMAGQFYETVPCFVTNGGSSVFSITCATGILGPPGSGNPAVFYFTNGANQFAWLYLEHHGGLISAKVQQHAP